MSRDSCQLCHVIRHCRGHLLAQFTGNFRSDVPLAAQPWSITTGGKIVAASGGVLCCVVVSVATT